MTVIIPTHLAVSTSCLLYPMASLPSLWNPPVSPSFQCQVNTTGIVSIVPQSLGVLTSVSYEYHHCYRHIHQFLPFHQCQMNITVITVISANLPFLISVRWISPVLSRNPPVSPFLISVRWASPSLLSNLKDSPFLITVRWASQMLSWNPPVSPLSVSDEYHNSYREVR